MDRSLIKEFLSEPSGILTVKPGDLQMPVWLTAAIRALPAGQLVIEKKNGCLTAGDGAEGFQFQTPEKGEKGITVICSGFQELNLKGLPEIPEMFRFLEGKLQACDTCFGVTFYGEEIENQERYLVSGSWTLELLPGLIALEQIGAQLVRHGVVYSLEIFGTFRFGDKRKLTAVIDCGMYEDITVSLLAQEKDGLPSLAELLGYFLSSDQTSDSLSGFGIGLGDFLNLEVDEIVLRINSKKKTLTDFTIRTRLTFLHTTFDVAFQWPNLSITGQMAKGQVISLTSLWKGMESHRFPMDFNVESAVIRLDLAKKTDSLSCGLGGEWKIGPLTLTGLNASLNEEVGKGLEGSIAGFIRIGTQSSLYVSAAYDAERKDWSFLGKLSAGSGLSIQELLGFLKTNFGLTDIPDYFDRVSIKEVRMEYHTADRQFLFAVEGQIQMGDTPSAIEILVRMEESMGILAAEYQCSLTQKLSLGAMAAALSPSLEGLFAGGMEITLKDLQILAVKGKEKNFISLGAILDADLSVAEIPVIGNLVPENMGISIDGIRLAYLKGELKKTEVQAVNQRLEATMTKLPEEDLNGGMFFNATVKMFGEEKKIELKESGKAPANVPSDQASTNVPPDQAPANAMLDQAPANAMPVQAPANVPPDQASTNAMPVQELANVPPDQASTNAVWLMADRQLGPLLVERAGVRFDDGVLWLILDASLHLGPVTLALQGAGVGSSLNRFSPKGNLDGAAIACTTGGISIAGSLVKKSGADPESRTDPASRTGPESGTDLESRTDLESGTDPEIRFQMDGSILIQAGTWSLTGIASYGIKNGTQSFFAFVDAGFRLGGCPAFVLTGLLGGFGYRQKLKLPDYREVEQFPLLQIGEGKSPDAVLKELEDKQWVVMDERSYWLAAGVKFTSFEMVKGKLLLTVLFGKELQIGVVGSGELTLPKGADKNHAYSYIKLYLSAMLDLRKGSLVVGGVLSEDSFLLDRKCRLTGGFAFATWFGDSPHSGDFVLTAGGYHPSFTPPAHYPKVNRVGVYWKMNDHLSLKGNAYLAVTPSCVMAGGDLEFLFDMGNVKAWFTAGANLLIAWKPFYFQADIRVEVGISCRLNLLFCHKTIRVSLGAALELSGPPIAGKVRIELWILSFTIRFGTQSGGQRYKALSWTEFEELLPEPGERMSARPVSGVGQSENKEEPWHAYRREFSFVLETVIPTGTIALRPMFLEDADSELTVMVTSPSNEEKTAQELGFRLQTVNSTLPASLWGAPLKEGDRYVQFSKTPTAEVARQQVTGYEILPPESEFGKLTEIENFEEALKKKLYFDNPFLPGSEEQGAFLPHANTGAQTMAQMKNMAMKTEKRTELCAALGTLYEGAPGTFLRMGDELYRSFADSPMAAK